MARQQVYCYKHKWQYAKKEQDNDGSMEATTVELECGCIVDIEEAMIR